MTYNDKDLEWYEVIGVVVAIVLLIKLLALPFQMVNVYKDNGDGTASKGLVLKDTINLSMYQKIGEGNSFVCATRGLKYSFYTRSINHETIKVCDK